jgi:hypothetical protein
MPLNHHSILPVSRLRNFTAATAHVVEGLFASQRCPKIGVRVLTMPVSDVRCWDWKKTASFSPHEHCF